MQTRIYATGASRREVWELPESGKVNIVPSWIFEFASAPMPEVQTRIEMEIHSCDALFLYYELKDGGLKSPIFETGVALGAGKPVYLIFPDARHHMSVVEQDLGFWVRHPKFKLCTSVIEAVVALETRLSKRGSLLRDAGPLPPGCHCSPGRCDAPKGYACRDPEKARRK